MAINNFISQIRQAISEYGVKMGIQLAVQKIAERVIIRTGKKINYGKKPLDYDWDVMIVLDACRSDLFKEFAPKHSVSTSFTSIDSHFSCASSSREWFKKGFDEAPGDDVSGVHYVTQNPNISHFDINQFNFVEELYNNNQETDTGLLHPSTVTDTALRAYKETSAERFVVHYMPPHAPFLHCPNKYTIKNKPAGWKTIDTWFGLQINEFKREDVWEDYGKNLLTVLDEVQRMIRHVDGDVIITSDHANAMGEFGIYSHPKYVPVPSVKKVPLVRAKGKGEKYDIGELDDVVDVEKEIEKKEVNVENQLEALGYK